MKTRATLVRPLAWTAGIAAVALFAAGLILGLQSTPLGSFSGSFGTYWPFPFAVMAAVGAFVAGRRPENATGWMFIGGGFWMVVNGFAQSYGSYALSVRAGLPAAHFVAWLAIWTWMPAIVFIALVLELFPTGRPLSSFWRWLVRIEFVAMGVVPLAALPALQGSTRAFITAPSPASVPGGAFVDKFNYPLPILLAVGFVAVVVRFVRARGVERQQMKWFVFGASILALSSLILALLATVLHVANPISNPPAAGLVETGTIAVPAAAAIAILRYRLYDIDRIISRTLAYAIVTVFLGAAFALVALIPTAVIGGGTKTPEWLIATATLLVVALFRPARRRVQNAVDHRFNRGRYDAEKTIDAFSAHLRDEIDISTLSEDLEAVVRRTIPRSRIGLAAGHEVTTNTHGLHDVEVACVLHHN